MRVLIAVTHLLGVGHLARAAAIGRGLARAGHEVALVSGGRPAPAVRVDGLNLLQLPAVFVKGTDFRTLYAEDGALAGPAVFEARRTRLLAALQAFCPDALIAELFPFGRRQLVDEHRALLAEVRRDFPECVVLSSIRDVLAPPGKPEKAAFAEEMLAEFFDGVLVHADPALVSLEASWPVTPGLGKMLAYTGYVHDGAEPGAESREKSRDSGEILVSGGGSETGLALMQAALAAALIMRDRRWWLLVGHGVSEPDFSALVRAAPGNATVERARRDFPELLAKSACSVSQAGYNTALDLLAARVPAVVVPFAAGGEQEQTIRAGRLAERGLVEVVPEVELSGDTVARAVERAIARGKSPKAIEIDRNGARNTASRVSAAFGRRGETLAIWRDCDRLLDRIAEAGAVLPVWWRDDDAVQPSDALDRLLALRARLDVPLALAVIPERATAALAQRLVGESGVCVLVHGISHINRAETGAKKQELVAGDDATVAALAEGRQRLDAMFGDQALPVLVPPWNRIAPTLVQRLGEAGFRALSVYGAADEAPAGLALINTHIDPIDWRGGGGLVRAPAHIAALRDVLATAVVQAEAGKTIEPVGFLTHHLVHDPWIWRFAGDLLERLRDHRAVRMSTLAALVEKT